MKVGVPRGWFPAAPPLGLGAQGEGHERGRPASISGVNSLLESPGLSLAQTQGRPWSPAPAGPPVTTRPAEFLFPEGILQPRVEGRELDCPASLSFNTRVWKAPTAQPCQPTSRGQGVAVGGGQAHEGQVGSTHRRRGPVGLIFRPTRTTVHWCAPWCLARPGRSPGPPQLPSWSPHS